MSLSMFHFGRDWGSTVKKTNLGMRVEITNKSLHIRFPEVDI